MLFASKSNFVVFLRRDGLSVYSATGQSAELGFSSELVQYIEVLDAPKLKEVITQFFVQQKGLAKQRGVILLDEGIVFQKILSLAKGLDIKKAQSDFEAKVPFDPEDHSLLSLQTKDQLVLLGTNKELYTVVGEALLALDCHITSVCPAIVYGIKQTSTFSPQLAQKVVNNVTLAERANFINGEHSLLT